jgi:hypothetical protein
MKISALAVASLISSVSAEFNLRAAVNQLLSTGQDETYDARIIVGGLKGIITNVEAEQVAKQAMAAYNDIFSVTNTAQKLNDIEATAATNIPSDSFWWTGECRFCSKSPSAKLSQEEAAFINARVEFSSFEDAAFLGMFLGQQAADPVDLHLKFEEDLCDRLRLSGIPNFAKAKDCSFSFLAKPGMTDQVPVKNTYMTSNGKTAQAELILAGLKKGITNADVQFLNEVVVDAHNEAFAKYGLSLGFFEGLADVAVGGFQGWLQQCTPCCFDDEPLCPDDAVQNTVTVIVGNAMPLRSASLSAVELKPMDAEITNKAFDTLVCMKLRNSGNPTFEDVHTCNFNFVYTEVGKATSALVN